MTKHRTISPDFVSRQEAAQRLMLSLRQIDRLTSAGVFPRVKISANRTGIPRHFFETYLATRPTNSVPDACNSKYDSNSANYYGLIVETTMSEMTLVTTVARLGLPGAISSRVHDQSGQLCLMWHNGLGYEANHLLATIARSELNIVPSSSYLRS